MKLSKHLSDLILDCAKVENQWLSENLNLGIFDMPELAFVYTVGKAIAVSKLNYLGSNDYRWMRETDFGNGGPTDLAFITSKKANPNFALEFKLDATHFQYKKDIDKLRTPFETPWNEFHWKKYFCALKRALTPEQGQEFMATLRTQFLNRAALIDEQSFKTKVENKKDQYCQYSFWEIL